MAPTNARTTAQIQQRFIKVREEERLHAVGLVLNHFRPARSLVFCNTKQQCRDLVEVLRAEGLVALELHGDLKQRDRDQVLVRSVNSNASVLVAPDIAVSAIEKIGSFTSEWLKLDALKPAVGGPLRPAMATVQILGGRKEKIPRGDALGALTKDMGFAAAQVGKLTVNDFATCVAVERGLAHAVQRKLNAGKVRGRSVKARLL